MAGRGKMISNLNIVLSCQINQKEQTGLMVLMFMSAEKQFGTKISRHKRCTFLYR